MTYPRDDPSRSRSRRVAARRLLAVGALAALAMMVSARQGGAPSKVATAVGTGGAAATVETLATEAAIDTLRRGGNAVDAAVAAAGVLGVTEPFSAGIGGGGFMVIYLAEDHRVTTIDHRENAPMAMRPDLFLENGTPLPFDAARFSGLAAGVPGTVAGWYEALERYGTWSLADALQPGIRVATDGFVIDQTFFDQTQANVDFFDDLPATAALFLDSDGAPRDVGTVFRNPDLAGTYQRLAELGPEGFYEGAVAEAILDTVRQPPVAPDANHAWRPGLMTAADLHGYVASERPPTLVHYRDVDVYGMAPPSSGGSTVGEALNILDGFDLSAMSRDAVLHYALEASRFAFADRNAYLGDADFAEVPLAGLVSDCFAAQRRSLITESPATSPVGAGDPFPCEGREPSSGTVTATGSTAPGTTTHLTVSDLEGNVVSYTFTLESVGGNGMVVPGHGFLLNNELTDFNLESTAHPNRVEGGKRPRSSMSPTIVLRDDAPILAVGAAGGSAIITTVLQILVDHLDRGATLPEAMAAARATQRDTGQTLAEAEFLAGPGAAALVARGHALESTGEIAVATGIEFLDGGRVRAAAEPVRRDGGSAMVQFPE